MHMEHVPIPGLCNFISFKLFVFSDYLLKDKLVALPPRGHKGCVL